LLVFIFISLSITIAYADLCSVDLQICTSSCSSSSVCIPYTSDCTTVCTSVDPVCLAGGCSSPSCVGGSVTICSVFSAIQDEVNNINGQISSLTTQLSSYTTQLTNLTNTVTAIENTNLISQFPTYFENMGTTLSGLGSDFSGLLNTIEAGIELPIKIVQLFPTLINSINPEEIAALLIKRGQEMIDWFVKSIVSAIGGLGNGIQCATCLYTEFQNGAITFAIEVDDGPGMGLSVQFAGLEPLYCFVNSLDALAVIMDDLFPTQLLTDTFATLAEALTDIVQELADFATLTIVKTKICNTSKDAVPTVASPSTGIPAIDQLLKSLTNFVNMFTDAGVFGKIAQGFVSAICSANYTSEAAAFTNDVQNFVSAVSFPNIADRIFKVVFSILNKVSSALATFQQLNFALPDTCNPSNVACQLALEYGSSYLQCIQAQINANNLSLILGIELGEHWLPPSITGWSIGVACTTLNCWECVLGIKSGEATLTSIFKLIVNEIMGSSYTENDAASSTTCNTTLTCTGGGTWDATACACRCDGVFLSTKAGCQQCPTNAANQICNDKGVCYNTPDGPACCCTGNINTTNCV